MRSVHRPVQVLRDLAWLGCVAVAAATACAGPVTGGSPNTAPGGTAPATAPGAPVAVASAVARAVKTTPGPTGASASRAPVATSPGGALLVAGNPDGHAAVPAAAQAVVTSRPDHVIGHGTPASCTSAAVIAAVAAGGVITFSCGPAPVTITMTAAAAVPASSRLVVLDGGGKVTLTGDGKTQVLSMNAGWQQQWPQLVVQNLALTDGNGYDLTVAGTVIRDSTAREGGGAIFFVVNADGGTLRIESSTLQGNPSGEFQNAPGIFDSVNGQDTQPVVVSSSIG